MPGGGGAGGGLEGVVIGEWLISSRISGGYFSSVHRAVHQEGGGERGVRNAAVKVVNFQEMDKQKKELGLKDEELVDLIRNEVLFFGFLGEEEGKRVGERERERKREREK